MRIGDFNLFEIGSVVDSSHLGNCNLIEFKGNLKIRKINNALAYVEKDSKIGNGCVISACAHVDEGSQISDHTVVLENGHQRNHINFNEEALKFNIKSKLIADFLFISSGLSEILATSLPASNNIRKFQEN
jgi:hypothetical protein